MEQNDIIIRPEIADQQLEVLNRYFPELDENQKKQFDALYALYADWNAKINVISRKDIENLYLHHVLHSLGITQMLKFKAGSSVMDIGTGGGFPGIPLAILFPEVQFHLVDSIGKKIKVAQSIAEAIGLKNVTFRHARGEEEKRLFDFVVSRAVMPLADLVKIVRKNIAQEYPERTNQRLAQRTDLPERRRIGARNPTLPQPGFGHQPVQLFSRGVF